MKAKRIGLCLISLLACARPLIAYDGWNETNAMSTSLFSGTGFDNRTFIANNSDIPGFQVEVQSVEVELAGTLKVLLIVGVPMAFGIMLLIGHECYQHLGCCLPPEKLETPAASGAPRRARLSTATVKRLACQVSDHAVRGYFGVRNKIAPWLTNSASGNTARAQLQRQPTEIVLDRHAGQTDMRAVTLPEV